MIFINEVYNKFIMYSCIIYLVEYVFKIHVFNKSHYKKKQRLRGAKLG